MDHSSLRRLLLIGVASILWAWLMLAAGSAFAFGPVEGIQGESTWIWRYKASGPIAYGAASCVTAGSLPTEYIYETPAAAAAAVAAADWGYSSAGNTPAPPTGAGQTTSVAVELKKWNTVTNGWIYCGFSAVGEAREQFPTPTCPANATVSGGGCVCDLGYKSQTDPAVCDPYTCEAKPLGETVTGPFTSSAQGGSATYCDITGPGAGCSVQFTSNMKTQGDDGSWYVSGSEVQTTAPCQGDGSGGTNDTGVDVPNTGTEPVTPCAAGTYPGTVNGTPVCIPGVSKEGTGTETKTNPDGTTVTTSTQTKCAGGTCTTTTTTTTKDAGGNVTGTETKETTTTEAAHCAVNPGDTVCGTGTEEGDEEETDPFCTENPDAPICKDSTWGGTCGAFTCDGDAVQCAMAREQHIRNCQLYDEATPESTLGLESMNGEAQPVGHPGATPEVVALGGPGGGFDQTDLVGGSCPADMSMTIQGHSLTVPFSSLCTPATWLGNLLVAITAIACVGIVFRS